MSLVGEYLWKSNSKSDVCNADKSCDADYADLLVRSSRSDKDSRDNSGSNEILGDRYEDL